MTQNSNCVHEAVGGEQSLIWFESPAPIRGLMVTLETAFTPLPSSDYCFGDCKVVNALPNDNILDKSKFKAFADDKMNMVEQLKFVFGRVENIAGKGENAGDQHFLLFL